jgi:hypothetical protein
MLCVASLAALLAFGTAEHYVGGVLEFGGKLHRVGLGLAEPKQSCRDDGY